MPVLAKTNVAGIYKEEVQVVIEVMEALKAPGLPPLRRGVAVTAMTIECCSACLRCSAG